MALPDTPAPDPARDPRKSRLLRGLYALAKEQVESGERTLPDHARPQSSTEDTQEQADKP